VGELLVLKRGDQLPPHSGDSAVTIGFFDGLHRGHRALLARTCDEAALRLLVPTVVTFDQHPARVLRPDSAPLLLSSLEEKLALLSETCVERALVVQFDRERARETAEDFVVEVLVQQLRARLVIVGEDFHFGHRRSGNVALLEELGSKYGFDVIGLGLVGVDGEHARPEMQVSSTAIRRALAEGRVRDANNMLGRPVEIRGSVVTGDKRGRLIGFPTANVAVPAETAMPADGIYAGYLLVDGATLPAAIYYGRRPTFYDDQESSLLEVHCLDWDGDLYGKDVIVRFDYRVRGEAKFESVDALAVQLARDCDRARDLLGAPRP
jgi:riboflavin kinase/FMN adenylyltransferase